MAKTIEEIRAAGGQAVGIDYTKYEFGRHPIWKKVVPYYTPYCARMNPLTVGAALWHIADSCTWTNSTYWDKMLPIVDKLLAKGSLLTKVNLPAMVEGKQKPIQLNLFE